MQLLYLSLSYVPSRRASSLQVMNMCNAFVELGHSVMLVTKNNHTHEKINNVDPFEFYGLAPCFNIIKLSRPHFSGGGIIYALEIFRLLLKNKDKVDLVYCRDFIGCWFALMLGYRGIFEAHDVPEGRLAKGLFKRIIYSRNLERLVLNSNGLLDELEKGNLLVSDDLHVMVVRNGTAPVDIGISNPDIPEQFNMHSVNIGYAGNLYSGRGIEVVIALARCFPEVGFHIIGGSTKDVSHWKEQTISPNLYFHGFVLPAHLKSYYQALDILLMPYQRNVMMASGKTDSSRWMSPLKMFEYMATGKPIVSSDLPVLHEVLTHERNALLVAPDDVDGWVTAVTRLINDPELRQHLGQTARQDLLAQYTWEARARKVLDGL